MHALASPHALAAMRSINEDFARPATITLHRGLKEKVLLKTLPVGEVVRLARQHPSDRLDTIFGFTFDWHVEAIEIEPYDLFSKYLPSGDERFERLLRHATVMKKKWFKARFSKKA